VGCQAQRNAGGLQDVVVSHVAQVVLTAETDRNAVVVLEGERHAAERAVSDGFVVGAVDVAELAGWDRLVLEILHTPNITDTTDVVKRCGIGYAGSMHTMPPRTGPILNFVVDDDLIRRLDDFRYTRRFPSRAAAVKALLRWALDQQPDLTPES
jgi:hypothetical protein